VLSLAGLFVVEDQKIVAFGSSYNWNAITVGAAEGCDPLTSCQTPHQQRPIITAFDQPWADICPS
jgi:hypothetical protein